MTQILYEPPGSQPGSSELPRDRRPSPRRSPAWHPSARGLVAAAAAVALIAGLGVTAAGVPLVASQRHQQDAQPRPRPT
jgi:hypothetical protein